MLTELSPRPPLSAQHLAATGQGQTQQLEQLQAEDDVSSESPGYCYVVYRPL